MILIVFPSTTVTLPWAIRSMAWGKIFHSASSMIVAVDPADVDKTMEAMKAAGDTPYVVGTIEAGEKGVTLC